MSQQQFRVLDGASISVKSTFFRGPCILPQQAAEWLSSKSAGRSGKSSMEDAIANGFIEPVGAVSHVDGDILNPGVRSSEMPAIREDANNSKPTPDSLKISSSEGGISSGVKSQSASDPNAVSQGESLGGPQENPHTVESTEEWDFSDEQLAGKSLDELNLLIVERLPMDERPTFAYYEDESEAKAHLQGSL